MAMARVIKADGEVLEVRPKNGKDFKADEIHEFVGGHFEFLYLGSELMAVNEEGRLLGLDFNPLASYKARQLIVGDVLLCGKNQVR